MLDPEVKKSVDLIEVYLKAAVPLVIVLAIAAFLPLIMMMVFAYYPPKFPVDIAFLVWMSKTSFSILIVGFCACLGISIKRILFP